MATISETNTVAASTTSVQLLPKNVSRLEDTVANDSTAILNVLEGDGTASASNFTFLVPARSDAAGLSYYVATDWGGAVQGVWASANGAARITRRSR